MKTFRSLFVLASFLLLAAPGFSQAQFSVGLKGGLNLAKFDIAQGVSNIDNRTGFHGGAFALVKLTKIGIQPEVLFSKQGSSYRVNTTDVEANFDYINVPIMLKLYLAAGLNLQAGPQFGFLSTSELRETVSGVVSVQDARDRLGKKSDTSLAFGAGWDLPFGLMIEARYTFGLSDIQLRPSTTAPVDFKNQVIQISLGYKLIKLGK
jgi:hypothetical protein